jgi:hypothetical protein
MKTALKTFALCLLFSGSCGFATPLNSEAPHAEAAKAWDLSKDVHITVVAITAVVAYDYVQEYVLAPYVQEVPVIGRALEFVRNAIDIKKRN